MWRYQPKVHLVANIGTVNSSRRWQNWEVCCCRIQINGWICIFHSFWLVCIGNARSQQVVSTTCVSIHSKSLLLQILHWAALHAWHFAFSGHQWRWKKQTRVNDDLQFWIFWSLNLWFFMLNLRGNCVAMKDGSAKTFWRQQAFYKTA